MSEDLPFKAEYAKSGRAGCQSCKTNISQDSLRIAKMVQSPHFDGKIPRWFHFNCFFKKSKVKDSAEIAGLDSLRWEDQQKIKKLIEGDAEEKSAKDEVDSGAEKDYQTEYAKSNRSKCKGCQEKIEKGEVRIAKMVEPDATARYARGNTIPNWYHVACFVSKKDELVDGDLTSQDIKDFSSLSKEDQKMLSSKIGLAKGKKKKNVQSEKKGSKKEEVKKEDSKKEEAEEETQLRVQSQKLWKIKDNLKKSCTLTDLREMLALNNQKTTGGEDALLSLCADGMRFGALDVCPECNNGHLQFESKGYKCTGHMSGWTPCIYVTTKPTRKPWKIPSDLKESNEYLNKFPVKLRERIFPKVEAPKPKISKPLDGCSVVLIGRLKKPKAAMTKIVEDLGGSVKSRISDSTFCCISTKGEVDAKNKHIQTAELRCIPVVSEDYLEAAKKGGAKLLLKQYSIVPWKTDENRKRAIGNGAEDEQATKKQKLQMKGGAVVDPDSELETKAHVYTQGKEIYCAVLGLVDLTKGTNSFYKIQLLESDTAKKYWLFKSWGRVGTSIGDHIVEIMGSDKERAIRSFLGLFEEKTGNKWTNRGNFVKHPNRFYPLDIDHGQDDDNVKQILAKPSCDSKLSLPIQELIRMIFDIESMKNAMIEFEIDLKKMPLGKLSKAQIQSAYGVLTELQKCLSESASHGKILDASNRFYTLIPHDFGLKKPPLLDNDTVLKSKIDMLDNLLDIEVAYSLLKGSEGGDKNPLDSHYDTLKTDIQLLEKESKEFKIIQQYVKNTHAKTHSSYSLEIIEVFKVARAGEYQRYEPFKELHNRKLLWHGSRTTNYAGILSQGLRIAPPEAPVTGYMFGKGIYFADMVSKSANYCRTSSTNPVGLMLLCEVALGDMYELTQAKSITKLPTGKHSCKGIGRTSPNPANDLTLSDGTVIPQGAGVNKKAKNSDLLYNEYIVYDVAQVNIKYLLKLNFNYSSRW